MENTKKRGALGLDTLGDVKGSRAKLPKTSQDQQASDPAKCVDHGDNIASPSNYVNRWLHLPESKEPETLHTAGPDMRINVGPEPLTNSNVTEINHKRTILDLQVTVANNQEHILQLQEDIQEWKEHVAALSRATADSYQARLGNVEVAIADLSRQFNRRAGSEESRTKEICRSQIDGFKRKFQAQISRDIRTSFSENAAINTMGIAPPGSSSFKTELPRDDQPITGDSEIPELILKRSDSVSQETSVATPDIIAVAQSLFAGVECSPARYFTDPQLTSHGYQTLLRNFDFKNVTQLENLSRIDNTTVERDFTIYCDIAPPSYKVDYVIRSGGLAASIMDNVPPVGCKDHPSLQTGNLKQLRLFELVLSGDGLNNKESFKFMEWKKQCKPPRYAYELGQLFLSRQHKKEPKNDSRSCSYNVVMDVARPEKPIWLVSRPGCPRDTRKQKAGLKGCTSAFNGLGGAMTACIAQSINDLELTWGRMAQNSFPQFKKAVLLATETSCSLPIEIRAKAANIMEMEEAMSSNL